MPASSPPAAPPRTDVHQHVWTEPLVAALARRSAPPRVRSAGADWVLELDGEPPFVLDLAGDDPARRAALVAADGLDRALVALSSPLGIEALPPDEAAPLLAAYAEGARALGPAFAAWGALAPAHAGPGDVDAVLDAGAVGLSLPAGALATPAGLEALGPLLEALERRGAPLLVHPGPAAAHPEGAPAWWPVLTGYVAELAAARLAFAHRGRAAHPRLRVVFVALAGGVPLHVERLAARGGAAVAASIEDDPGVFHDTSSYGPRAVRACADAVGWAQLVLGSDRPYAEPLAPARDRLGGNEWDTLSRSGPARLLGLGAWQPSPAPPAVT
jgi:hypothetical protein